MQNDREEKVKTKCCIINYAASYSIKNKMKKSSLSDLQKEIGREVKYLDKKPYSHNIISLDLRIIDKDYGKHAAIETMKKFKLNKHGWIIPTE